jgi:hypothetical protein
MSIPLSPGKLLRLLVLAALLLSGTAVHASLMQAPTTSWNVIRYGGNPSTDPSTDQQTGSAEGDIVGNSTHASAYVMFDNAGTPSTTDGNLLFRVRLGADANPAGFQFAFMVGLITDRSAGRIDLFLGVNNSGSGNHIGIFNPGTGLNVSPNTTTIVSPALVSYTQTAANYHWGAVTPTLDPVATNFDLDGGGNVDHFLSFSVPFSTIVAQLAAKGITADENTAFSYVIATSTQGNSLNQDLMGVGAGYSTSATWASLGVLSDGTPPIAVVPEINPSLAVILLLVAALAHRQWQQRRARPELLPLPARILPRG